MHTKPLPELQIGETVSVQSVNPKHSWVKGPGIGKVGNRSYIVETDKGIYRRNRKFLRQDKVESRSQPVADVSDRGKMLEQQTEEDPEEVTPATTLTVRNLLSPLEAVE
ncbi:Uncharacterised protein at_DN2492 [Pycnogonum litorale]